MQAAESMNDPWSHPMSPDTPLTQSLVLYLLPPSHGWEHSPYAHADPPTNFDSVSARNVARRAGSPLGEVWASLWLSRWFCFQIEKIYFKLSVFDTLSRVSKSSYLKGNEVLLACSTFVHWKLSVWLTEKKRFYVQNLRSCCRILVRWKHLRIRGHLSFLWCKLSPWSCILRCIAPSSCSTIPILTRLDIPVSILLI